jgi:nitroreductase
MDTWDAIRGRRTVRQLTEEPIDDEDMWRLLEAARRAPSANSKQPCDFIVVTKADELRELSTVWPGARHIAGAAAAIAVVIPVADEADLRWEFFDAGQAVMSIALAATELGVAAAHGRVVDQEKVRALLGLPDDRMCVCLVGLGHPTDRPLRPLKRPNRRPLEDVVHRHRW